MHKVAWNGIFTVIVTPFAKNGQIDEPRFKQLIDDVIRDGASGIIVAGSTGEFYAMSREERVSLIRIAVAHTAGRVPVLAGVADLRVDDVLDACKAAQAAGCAGAMVLPPLYAMPNSSEIIAFYEYIAKSCSLPLMLYNSPRRTGVEISPEMVAQLAALPNVVAIKDSSASIVHVADLLQRTGDKLRVFVGYETMVVPARALGVHGVVAMAHQVAGPLVRDYWNRAASPQDPELEKLGRDVFAFYRCFQSGSYYSAIKECMRLMGRDAGETRRPLLPLSDSQKAAVAKIVKEAGLTRWAVKA